MSLYLYREKSEIPANMPYILNNSAYFKALSIPQTDQALEVLQKVEQAEYVSSLFFQSKKFKFGAMNKAYLSTGTKTLLNILTDPDVCFDIIECGVNVITQLLKFTSGHVYIGSVAIQSEGSPADTCDIVYRNKRYTNLGEFADVINNYSPEE